MGDIHVIVCDNGESHMIGKREFKDPDGPLVMEQYANTATVENMQKRIDYLGGKYGNCRIAKLVFLDEEGN